MVSLQEMSLSPSYLVTGIAAFDVDGTILRSDTEKNSWQNESWFWLSSLLVTLRQIEDVEIRFAHGEITQQKKEQLLVDLDKKAAIYRALHLEIYLDFRKSIEKAGGDPSLERDIHNLMTRALIDAWIEGRGGDGITKAEFDRAVSRIPVDRRLAQYFAKLVNTGIIPMILTGGFEAAAEHIARQIGLMALTEQIEILCQSSRPLPQLRLWGGNTVFGFVKPGQEKESSPNVSMTHIEPEDILYTFEHHHQIARFKLQQFISLALNLERHMRQRPLSVLEQCIFPGWAVGEGSSDVELFGFPGCFGIALHTEDRSAAKSLLAVATTTVPTLGQSVEYMIEDAERIQQNEQLRQRFYRFG